MKDTKAHPKTALDVLQGMLEKGNSPLAQDFKRYRLKLDWEQVVGPTISARCSPVGYANGIVYIWVISASWMNQLVYGRKELIKKINQHVGKGWAREIRFTQDKRDVPKEALSQSD
jgi:predicted nucleic acid-binding Zn ribbon protein